MVMETGCAKIFIKKVFNLHKKLSPRFFFLIFPATLMLYIYIYIIYILEIKCLFIA